MFFFKFGVFEFVKFKFTKLFLGENHGFSKNMFFTFELKKLPYFEGVRLRDLSKKKDLEKTFLPAPAICL